MIQEVWTLLSERASFFLGLCGEHLAISLIAIIIAVLIGGALGIFMSEYQKSARLVMPIVNFLYTIPSISMLGFLILLSGIGNLTAVIALTLYALLPMVRSTYTGLTTVNAGIIEAAEGMGSTGRQILWKIKLPLAMPIILSGIRNMVVMTLALAGIASFIGAGGLGVAIYRGITTNNAAMTVTGSLLIAALALIFDLILGKVEKRCGQHHSPSSNKRRRRPAVIGCAALAAVILSTALFLRAGRTPTIRIATKPMSEQYILGEMLDILIEENTDLNVEITQGVGGGTSNIQPAMEQGEFNIYPEYTGTAWNMVLKNDDLYTEERFDELQDAYAQDYDMEWIGMYGFNNSYALAVRSEIAQQYDLKNISDLRGIADELTFGAEYDFYEREDGYSPLCETYGLTFANTVDLDIGLKYQAIAQDEIDVMPIFTTDGQVSVSDLVILNDDLHFYPSYQCGNVVRSKILERYPQLRDVLGMVEGILSDRDMAHLNYLVESENVEPRDAARQYLQENGLITEEE